MLKEEKVINYYVLCNKLKDLIRTGWKNWNIKRNRVESVAEHIFGVQMIAIAMKSEYNYDVDLMKVIYMIAIHELGEIIIGDLTEFQISKEEKEKQEHSAVHKILDGLIDSKQIEELFLEFDSHSTKEALFAYQCDKLECDLQCKLYDEEKCFNLDKKEICNEDERTRIQEYLKTGKSLSTMWIKYDQEKLLYDENFNSVLNYTLNNKILKNIDDLLYKK